MNIVVPSCGKIFSRFWFAFILAGCLTPIDFPTERVGNALVVSGQISTLQERSTIQLGRTAATDRVPIPVSGASVVLEVSTGESYQYEEDLTTRGIYILSGITGIAGNTYYIRIRLGDDEVYESVAEKMPESAGEISSRFETVWEEYADAEGIILLRPFVKLYANAVLPDGDASYFKWNAEETFLLSPTDFPDPFGNVPPSCYVTQSADPQRIPLLNTGEVKAASVESFVASRLIDWSFNERHYFTTYQSSLTREAFEYWRKVNILVNQVGSIFDTPPAQINGNIFNVNKPNEEVLGYFQATNEAFDRFYVLPDGLNAPIYAEKCLYDPSRTNYPSRCLDCLSVRNSSYMRPAWF
jgi:hypothetical protein